MNAKYRRMLDGMVDDGPKEWSVYILRCEDGSLYTGVAKDVMARFEKHQKGNGASYTRMHRPLALLYREDQLTRSQALRREFEIKRLPKKRKESLALDRDEK